MIKMSKVGQKSLPKHWVLRDFKITLLLAMEFSYQVLMMCRVMFDSCWMAQITSIHASLLVGLTLRIQELLLFSRSLPFKLGNPNVQESRVD
jgi:hypothetical protein